MTFWDREGAHKALGELLYASKSAQEIATLLSEKFETEITVTTVRNKMKRPATRTALIELFGVPKVKDMYLRYSSGCRSGTPLGAIRSPHGVIGETTRQLSRKKGLCKWPIGNPDDAHFRSCDKECEGNYCDEHRAIAIEEGQLPEHEYRPGKRYRNSGWD